MTQLPLFSGDDHLDKPQAAARRTDPETSHEAARDVEACGSAAAHRAIIAKAVREHPGHTSDELPDLCGLDFAQVHKRMKEIETIGLIRRGDRRPNTNGRRAVTWWPA